MTKTLRFVRRKSKGQMKVFVHKIKLYQVEVDNKIRRRQKFLGTMGIVGEDFKSKEQAWEIFKKNPDTVIIKQKHLEELLNSYSTHLKAQVEFGNIKNGTYVLYEKMKRHFDSMKHMMITQIKYADIEALKHHLAFKKLSNRSINIVLCQLRKSFVYAQKMEWLEAIPLIESLKEPVTSRKPISEDELRILFMDNNPRYHRLKLYMSILMHTGMRPAELNAMYGKDIDLEKRVMHIPKIKANTMPRTIPFNNTIYKLFESLKYKDDDRLNPYSCTDTGCRALREHCKRNDLEQYTPTHFRHTYIHIMLKRNVPAHIVSALVGHKQDTTTMKVYAHIDAEMMRPYVEVIM